MQRIARHVGISEYSYSITDLDRLFGFQHVEVPRLSRQREGGKVVSPTHRPPSPILISVRD
jgi:hypothetical protein